jgi:hypothetical protein
MDTNVENQVAHQRTLAARAKHRRDGRTINFSIVILTDDPAGKEAVDNAFLEARQRLMYAIQPSIYNKDSPLEMDEVRCDRD